MGNPDIGDLIADLDRLNSSERVELRRELADCGYLLALLPESLVNKDSSTQDKAHAFYQLLLMVLDTELIGREPTFRYSRADRVRLWRNRLPVLLELL